MNLTGPSSGEPAPRVPTFPLKRDNQSFREQLSQVVEFSGKDRRRSFFAGLVVAAQFQNFILCSTLCSVSEIPLSSSIAFVNIVSYCFILMFFIMDLHRVLQTILLLMTCPVNVLSTLP